MVVKFSVYLNILSCSPSSLLPLVSRECYAFFFISWVSSLIFLRYRACVCASYTLYGFIYAAVETTTDSKMDLFKFGEKTGFTTKVSDYLGQIWWCPKVCHLLLILNPGYVG